MNKIVFDPNEEGGLELARAVALERLRTDKDFNTWNDYNSDFSRFVEYIGDQNLSRWKFLALIQDVFWEFVVQGIIAPGNSGNTNFPSFFSFRRHVQLLIGNEPLKLQWRSP